MSYDSQRGGVSGAPDPFAIPETQKDCDGTGGSTCVPAAQDKPLLQVGSYSLPSGAIDTGLLTRDTQNVKKAGGVSSAKMPTWEA